LRGWKGGVAVEFTDPVWLRDGDGNGFGVKIESEMMDRFYAVVVIFMI